MPCPPPEPPEPLTDGPTLDAAVSASGGYVYGFVPSGLEPRVLIDGAEAAVAVAEPTLVAGRPVRMFAAVATGGVVTVTGVDPDTGANVIVAGPFEL